MYLANTALIDGGAVPTPARYTQPVSVPTPPVTQPLAPNDPRNNALYVALNNLQSSLQDMTAGLQASKALSDQMIASAAADKASAAAALADAQATLASLQSATPPSTEQVATTTSSTLNQSDLTTTASSDFSMLPPSNFGSVPAGSDYTTTSDSSIIPQPQAAIPAPTYALDTPTNLFIDINSFIKNSDGTYTANLTFDPIVGAVSKYNYRISATS